MRKTIRDLTVENNLLNGVVEKQRKEINDLKALLEGQKAITPYIPSITEALARVTEALAHVVADLKRR